MKLKNCSRSLSWATVLLATVFAAGCSSGDGGSGTSNAGTASVSMTDAPACGYDEVNVTVSKVRIHQSDSADENAAGWTDITLNPARKINLLNLNDPTQPNFALENLGETPLVPGHYTQLRLVLVPNGGASPFANSIVLSGQPGEIAVDTPSALQSGVKLIHQFDVASGKRVDLVLDFDACKSIVKRGNHTYALKPVVKVIPFEMNGIEGFVHTSLLGSNVVVSAQVNGVIVRSTVPNSSTGKFYLARLVAPGSSGTFDVVFTADGYATSVISGVPVPDSTSTTIVSTQAAPISLNSSVVRNISGTVTLNPAVDDESVLVTAKQALNGGPTVIVKSQVATVITATVPAGDYGYDLALPAAAPWLGPYNTPLPIVFTQQPVLVAGKYTVQASAAGYAPQSFDKDISAASTTQNFTLALAP